MALTFNPDNDPRVEEQRLSEELEEVRAEWIASKRSNEGGADLDVKERFEAAMAELRSARMHWRQVGEAAGSRHFISIQHNTPDPDPA